ncbi:MAG TPA: nitroreductase [Burkholderiales bacterium]|jgi:nitroreductase
MDFDTVIRSRFSARKFLDRPVPERTLQRILELAQHTASWCNCQPWQLTITRGAATERFRRAIHAHARSGARPNPDFPFPAAYEGVYRERRKVCGVQLYQALGIGREDRESAAQQALENFHLFGAPHVAIVTTEERLGVYGAIDCGLYVGNFLLAARNEGVDTIAQAALASYPDFVREFFSLPANRKVVCGISFGFADPRDPIHSYRTERAAVAEAVTFVET